jgi:hypothetical protein
MATARPSFTKRQRENAKRERQQLKAAKRAARKNNPENSAEDLDTTEELSVTSNSPDHQDRD